MKGCAPGLALKKEAQDNSEMAYTRRFDTCVAFQRHR